MTLPIKKISLMSIFIALGVILGFALIHIPNVELVTATIFIAGYLLGIKEGLIVGFFTETIYIILNPYGISAPPLFMAQVLSMSFTGGLGGIIGRQTLQTGILINVKFGLAGFLSTSLFAVLTIIAYAIFAGFSKQMFITSFFYGLLFYAVHLLSNTLIFSLLVPVILNVIKKTGFKFRSAVQEGNL